VAYNLVTTEYAAHLARDTEPGIAAICQGVADMVFTVLAPLALQRPLKGRSGAAIASPPALPRAVVLPDPAGGNVDQAFSNSERIGAIHRLDLVYLFSPDSTTAEELLTHDLDYWDATVFAFSKNQHLDIGLRGVRIAGWQWGIQTYAGKGWNGLRINLEAYTIYAARWFQ
jgi:hypothetical protein